MKSALLLLFSLLCNALSGDDSICNAHKSRRSFPLTDVGRCPSSHPDEDALLCYENCKSNYNGAGPVCWEKCDGTEIGPICQTQAMSTRAKDSYGRGAGTIPAECGSGKMNVAGLCYDNCRSGYSLWGLFCTTECPSGYEDHGLTCFKWDWFDSDTIWKDSYGIGIGKIPTGCASGKYNENGLCYSHCRSGYVGNGPVCWATCHSGEVDDGAFCRIPEESHLRGSYGRGVGVPLICPAGHEQIALDCYEWCGHDHTGFIGTCTSDKWLDATEAIAASFVPNHFLIAGCSIDTLVKGVMMLDTLSGHDYAGDGFDMCAVDDMLQHIEPTWEAGKGVFAIEFRVGIDLGIPMEQFGFLAQISAIAGKDYTNYDVFRADIAQHADERTLNDLDVFLRWLWDEILDESELNVYVGLAFETHAEGMNVYLYYGHCDGSAMDIGLNQMVYRSVEDIVGPQQVHAPTLDIFGAGIGWVYGLDEDCSLKSVGAALGKGDGGIKVNLDHIFDEDGFQCETPQVIPLIHQHDIECANGYYFQIGDIPGNGIGGLRQVPDCNECARLCSDLDNCLSYECSATELKCNLNNVGNPTAGAWKDYAFCTKNDGHATSTCANGYYSQIGDISGWGNVDGVGGGQQVSNCNECGKLCSDRSTCLSYECSPTDLKCNLNSDANPNRGAYGDYNFCTKQICGSGYYAQIGDIPGAGAVATGQPVSHCDDCAKLCSDHADCLSYECSMTDLNCNLNNVANPTAGAWKDYAFCTKNGPTTRSRLLNM